MKQILSSIVIIFTMLACQQERNRDIYVDPAKGSDQNPGTVQLPLASLDIALQIVDARVKEGILSDRIYLRGGTYRKDSSRTLYHLNLQGTKDAYTLLSAMPCEPGAEGCVEMKSGQWYEKVVFDDAWVIDTPWQRMSSDSSVWFTNPGYTQLEWIHKNLWPWSKYVNYSKNDSTPWTTLFTVAPYMLLQDGEPTFWVDSLHQLDTPGQRYYHQETGMLYFRPFNDKDPNQCLVETWYGGPEDYETGTLHLDGEGRGLFDGNLKYAAIKGLHFRMFNKIFQFNRRHYAREADRKIQQDVLLADNYFEYGWIHVLLDGNTVIKEEPDVIRPRYADRARWLVRDNIYYRPSREVFQIHGDDHVFEHNIIVDHLGPWAGPAACVSAVNARNTRNMKIRYNYIVGQGNNPWHSGSVFMIESGEEHADEQGNYLFGGQTYEYNLIADVSSGAAFVLGKGGARLKNVTVKNNIIKTNQKTAAIKMASPHENLVIEGNIFYDQPEIIEIAQMGRDLDFDSLPSSISICNNIFARCNRFMDSEFLQGHPQSKIIIENNLGWQNNIPMEDGILVMNLPVLFNQPEHFNFSLSQKASEMLKLQVGLYQQDRTLDKDLRYWQMLEKYPQLVPLLREQRQNQLITQN